MRDRYAMQMELVWEILLTEREWKRGEKREEPGLWEHEWHKRRGGEEGREVSGVLLFKQTEYCLPWQL